MLVIGLGLKVKIFGLGLEAHGLGLGIGFVARGLGLGLTHRPYCKKCDFLERLSVNFLQKTKGVARLQFNRRQSGQVKRQR